MGYQSAGSAHKIVNDALAVQVHEEATFLRSMEVSRLNALQLALWDQAMEGDLAAVTAITKIIDARCRVLGLYEASGQEDPRRILALLPRARDGCRQGGRLQTWWVRPARALRPAAA